MPARTLAPGWRSPFHPAHAVALTPMLLRHNPASITLVLLPLRYSKRGPPRYFYDSRVTRSIALEDQSGEVAARLQERLSYRFLHCFRECWPRVRRPGYRFSSE